MTVTADHIEGRNAQNSAAAFEDLFQEHWPRVCAVLYRLVGDRDEAEDLALEAFWQLYRRPPVVESPAALGGWLYRVATNLGYNALRSRKRRKRYEEEAGFEVHAEDPPWDPAVQIERAQERERVRAVLAWMKPRSAQLLVLRHSGFSYAELAETLGLSVRSIGTLLARAEQEFVEGLKKLEN